MKKMFDDSWPAIQKDMQTFYDWAIPTFFPKMHDALVGLTGDMREHRDGAVTGWDDIRAAAIKSWQEQEIAGDAHEKRLTAWKDYFLQTWAPGIDSGFDDVKNTALDILTVQMPLYWQTAIMDAQVAAHDISVALQTVRNAWLALKAAIFGGATGPITIGPLPIPNIPVPRPVVPGRGNGTVTPAPPPGIVGGIGHQSIGGGDVYNFYTMDNNLALRYLRQSGA